MSTVLVVDDNQDIQYLLQKALQLEGHVVWHAENGAAARELISIRGAPQIILLDLMMPVMNGREFLEWKAASEHVALPVLVISAQPDPTLVGIVGCLKKPIKLDQVYDAIEKHCA